jgi:sulfur relay (sulfurtransferase) complex TusBCD TusD component (DsrE family)
MNRDLQRVDQQLVNIQVQLAKLQVLVSDLCQPSAARRGGEDEGLAESVRRRRHDMVEQSKDLAGLIERLCRAMR